MKVYGLLTGRGNNTLKKKNILPVLGKPLLSYPANAAKKVIPSENLFVSSDSEEILNAASDCGYQSIVRPAEISQPDSKHIDAIFHAIEHIKAERNEVPDILVVLLANSATVKSEWIKQGIDRIIQEPKVSAVVPAYKEQDHHPFRAKKLGKNGELVPYFDFDGVEVSTNRQELPDNYFLSHNFWVLNVKESIEKNDGDKPWTFLGKNVQPIIVKDCFDVHTVDDLKRTEHWVKENL